MMHSNRSTDILTAGLSCRGILLQEDGGSIHVWLKLSSPQPMVTIYGKSRLVTPTLDPRKANRKSTVNRKIDGAIQRSSSCVDIWMFPKIVGKIPPKSSHV